MIKIKLLNKMNFYKYKIKIIMIFLQKIMKFKLMNKQNKMKKMKRMNRIKIYRRILNQLKIVYLNKITY